MKAAKQTGKKLVKAGLVIAGLLSLALGVVGIFVPILPTTPFLVLAAACFLRSSPRMYNWLYANRLFGEYLRNYRDKKGLPMASKILILVLLWLTLSTSIIVAVPARFIWLKLLLLAIGGGVSIHILRIKTAKNTM